MATIPVFLPEKSHGQRRLVGYSLMGRKELDMTERLSTAQHVEITNTVFPSFTYLI